jgi:hypothetical protein
MVYWAVVKVLHDLVGANGSAGSAEAKDAETKEASMMALETLRVRSASCSMQAALPNQASRAERAR